MRNTSVLPEHRAEGQVHTGGIAVHRFGRRQRCGAHGQGLAARNGLPLERGRGDLDRDPPVQPAVAGGDAVERAPDRRHGVVGERDHVVGEHRADEVVDTGDAQDLGGQRPGECVRLEQHEIRPELPADGDDVVDHVGRGHLGEQTGDEVVVDALGGEPVARQAVQDTGVQVGEPVHLAATRRRGTPLPHERRPRPDPRRPPP